MAVEIRSTATNVSQEQYDTLITRLAELLPPVPGFISHGSWVDEQGAHVVELWESREAFDAWYQERVVPAMQGMNVDVEMHVQPVATAFVRQS